MEFDFTIPGLAAQFITTWDAEAIRRLHPRSDQENMKKVLDVFGKRSAKAQGLGAPVTDIYRLLSTDQRLYVAATRNGGNTTVLGGLKTGVKKLFLRTADGALKEVDPVCVLDFYVHESCQRRGLGNQLFQHFLANEGLTAAGIAYDRPSPKLMSFLHKHYGLRDHVLQSNSFVVFNQFWQACPALKARVGRSTRVHGRGASVWQPVASVTPRLPLPGDTSASLAHPDQGYSVGSELHQHMPAPVLTRSVDALRSSASSLSASSPGSGRSPKLFREPSHHQPFLAGAMQETSGDSLDQFRARQQGAAGAPSTALTRAWQAEDMQQPHNWGDQQTSGWGTAAPDGVAGPAGLQPPAGQPHASPPRGTAANPMHGLGHLHKPMVAPWEQVHPASKPTYLTSRQLQLAAHLMAPPYAGGAYTKPDGYSQQPIDPRWHAPTWAFPPGGVAEDTRHPRLARDQHGLLRQAPQTHSYPAGQQQSNAAGCNEDAPGAGWEPNVPWGAPKQPRAAAGLGGAQHAGPLQAPGAGARAMSLAQRAGSGAAGCLAW